MAVSDCNLQHLRDNPFWKKKFDKAVRVHDTNKNGYISRADFDLVVTRYKNRSTGNPAHAERVGKSMDYACKNLGLEGDTSMSYSQFEEKFVDVLEKVNTNAEHDLFYGKMFDTVDTDGDGSINLAEWRMHYECYGIPVEHADASFRAMDRNHDTLLSREEFKAYHVEYFFTSEDKLNSSILYGPLD